MPALPLIVNHKTVDPSDASPHAGHPARDGDGRGDRVVEGARAVQVPRRRFAPVKTTDDLLACGRTPTC